MKIIDPIDRKLIKEELNAKTFIRSTRKGGNEIYIVNNHNAPNVLKEISDFQVSGYLVQKSRCRGHVSSNCGQLQSRLRTARPRPRREPRCA